MNLLPSIASASQIELGEEIRRLKSWPFLHIDIEDGNFLPNITFGMKTVKAIAAAAEGKILDAHLLVTNPMDYLEPMAELGVQKICAHIEALPYPMQFLNRARQLGMKAGLALNMATPVSHLDPFYPAMDFVLLMTAEPDSQGDQLYPPALDRAVRLAEDRGGEIEIFADGGLNEAALQRLARAGAAAAVLGRLAFGANQPFWTLSELQALIQQ